MRSGQCQVLFDFLSLSLSLFFILFHFEPSAVLRSGRWPDGSGKHRKGAMGNRKQFTQCHGIKDAEGLASASWQHYMPWEHQSSFWGQYHCCRCCCSSFPAPDSGMNVEFGKAHVFCLLKPGFLLFFCFFLIVSCFFVQKQHQAETVVKLL